ncbi:hypothetical protein [Haloferula sp. BvORR071]|uniref:hypothetical protein n=1 Tax=Haloferula sp. BvORR071 TaxID=1396141 RepID=UPI0005520AF7|nr:hypothetical protein [Haloferula sp. BvORR071]
MPPFARFIITLCVGVPAVLARIGGILWAGFEGVLLLAAPERLSPFFGPHSGTPIGNPLAFAIALTISVVGYLVDAGVDYVNSRHRQAVPPREIAVLIVVELAVQLLGVAAACLLIATVFMETAATPLGHPAFTTAGMVCGGAALFLTVRYRQRTNNWRAAWKDPAAGDFDLTS